MGPVPALMGTVPLSLTLASVGEPVDRCEFSRNRRALPLKARECKVRPHKGTGFPPLTSESTS